jgi:hypothetical protein
MLIERQMENAITSQILAENGWNSYLGVSWEGLTDEEGIHLAFRTQAMDALVLSELEHSRGIVILQSDIEEALDSGLELEEYLFERLRIFFEMSVHRPRQFST